MFFLQQSWRTRGRNRSAERWGFGGKGRGGLLGVAQIIYTYVSKCKNDKIKFLKIVILCEN
jgi:hypothetical protein